MMDYHFIGWNNENGHDKIWVSIKLMPGKWVTIWGRRGAKLQHKIVTSGFDIDKLVRSKLNKGYKRKEEYDLQDIYPEFEQDLKKTAFWAMLKV